MTYLLKDKPQKKNKSIWIFLLFLIIFLGVRLIFPSGFSALVLESSKSISKIGQFANISFGGSEISELEKEINDLKIKANDRNVLAEENERLRLLIERKGDRQSKVAAVISKPTFTPYDTFIIDVGSSDGITINSTVLAGSSTAIGIVTEVYSNISKVTAYSSPDIRHSVFIGPNNIQAEAIGQGNGNFKIVLPQGTQVNPGDNIIVPGITPTIFGIVEKIVASDQPSFINVLFKIPVNLSELYYVEVVQ